MHDRETCVAPNCGYKSFGKIDMKHHLKDTHNGNCIDSSDATDKCNISSIIPTKRSNLKVHRQTFHGKNLANEPDNASECGKSSKKKDKVRQHKENIQEQGYTVAANIVTECGYECEVNDNINLHTNDVHEQSQNLAAKKCGKKLETEDKLSLHGKTVHRQSQIIAASNVKGGQASKSHSNITSGNTADKSIHMF